MTKHTCTFDGSMVGPYRVCTSRGCLVAAVVARPRVAPLPALDDRSDAAFAAEGAFDAWRRLAAPWRSAHEVHGIPAGFAGDPRRLTPARRRSRARAGRRGALERWALDEYRGTPEPWGMTLWGDTRRRSTKVRARKLDGSAAETRADRIAERVARDADAAALRRSAGTMAFLAAE